VWRTTAAVDTKKQTIFPSTAEIKGVMDIYHFKTRISLIPLATTLPKRSDLDLYQYREIPRNTPIDTLQQRELFDIPN